MYSTFKPYSKPIKRGQRILTESPFAYVLASKYHRERCDNCLAERKILIRCCCQYVYYCNRTCQIESRPLHMIECTFLKRIHPRSISDTARLLCRLIIVLKNGGTAFRGYYTETSYRKFGHLMSHYGDIKYDFKRIQQLNSLYETMCEMMDDSKMLPNKVELLAIYGRLLINSFNILDGEMNSIGIGLYLGVSVTDHSCQPNAVATFDGITLHIHATEDMPRLDWSNVFISYIDLLQTPLERREELMMKYYFLCMCNKCRNPYETIEMNAAACPNKNCSESLNITLKNCPKCGNGISSEYCESFNEAIRFTRGYLEDIRDVIYLDVCKLCLEKQRDFVHPLNLWHVKTLDAAFEAAIQIGNQKDALDYGTQLFPGYRKYYGDWNPLLGLLYMKVAKIQLTIGCFKDAIYNFEQAEEILAVTHGQDHPLLQKQLTQFLSKAKECRVLYLK